MIKRATALAVAAISAATLFPATAHANTPGVGVDGCIATSPGDFAPGTCVAIVTGGYYWLEVSSSGNAWANVNCSRGGSASGSTDGNSPGYSFFFAATGDCHVLVWGEFSSRGRLFKF